MKNNYDKNIIKPSVFDIKTDVISIEPGFKYQNIYKYLKQGKKVYFKKTFGTVLSFYSWLKQKVSKEFPVQGYKSARFQRQKLRELAINILVKVCNGRPDLKGAPENPWLQEFFPENSEFYISFADLIGMNGAWQWYKNGISYPGLAHKLHPFYGTYFPTRFEHLELFDIWLADNAGDAQKAIDIGTGCGVLAFYMLKHNINRVCATDINPNAVYSTKKDLEITGNDKKVNVQHGNLFGEFDQQYDLIVFNPPWIPGESSTIIDKGIYYDENFWNVFFATAKNKMTKNSRLVLLFSNLAVIEGITESHPIEEHLKSDNSFKVNKVLKKQREVNYKKKRRAGYFKYSKTETVELWDISLSF